MNAPSQDPQSILRPWNLRLVFRNSTQLILHLQYKFPKLIFTFLKYSAFIFYCNKTNAHRVSEKCFTKIRKSLKHCQILLWLNSFFVFWLWLMLLVFTTRVPTFFQAWTPPKQIQATVLTNCCKLFSQKWKSSLRDQSN